MADLWLLEETCSFCCVNSGWWNDPDPADCKTCGWELSRHGRAHPHRIWTCHEYDWIQECAAYIPVCYEQSSI